MQKYDVYHKRPRGAIPVCHDEPMDWDKWRGEWRCKNQLAHWAKLIYRGGQQ